jgi:HEAT repeat protein
MKKQGAICLALGALVLFAGAEASQVGAEGSNDPVYKRKPLSDWDKQLKDNDPRRRRQVILELKNAVYAQIDEDQDWELAEQAIPLFTEALKDSDSEVRMKAAEALYRFGAGPKADAEVADLIKALEDKDPNVRWHAAYDLRFHRPAARAAAPALVKALRDPDISIRRTAAISLGLLGPEGKAAVPLLIEALKHEPDFIGIVLNYGRVDAARALGRIGPDAKVAVPALVEALRDRFPWVRAEAASALGGIGSGAKVALPALRRTMKDQNARVRTSAAIAIWYLGRQAKEPLPILLESLKGKDREDTDFDPLSLKTAVQVIGEMGPEAKKAGPTLVPLLKETRWGIRREAVKALKKIDPDAAKMAGLD